jgi:hypothetical protein
MAMGVPWGKIWDSSTSDMARAVDDFGLSFCEIRGYISRIFFKFFFLEKNFFCEPRGTGFCTSQVGLAGFALEVLPRRFHFGGFALEVSLWRFHFASFTLEVSLCNFEKKIKKLFLRKKNAHLYKEGQTIE